MESRGQSPEDRFTPQFFVPALRLMDIPDDWRASVSIHLDESLGIGNYGSFIFGLQTIREQAIAVGDFFREAA